MIDHNAEATAALPHELGCFEIFAEELVETGVAETGEYDEALAPSFITVIDLFHQTMIEDPERCECQARLYEAI